MYIYYHDGMSDFPHGAGSSEEGWYVYDNMTDPPNGPYPTREAASLASMEDPEHD